MSEADLAAVFRAGMDRLGPFEPEPALAVAVSGGADSMALVLLARMWAGARAGSVQALIVDHGLRAESGEEARVTLHRLKGLGIAGRVLPISGLARGPALAERARAARYAVLAAACAEAGLLHLLLGHHAADQAETLAMRVLRGSQNAGLAGMAALRETPGVRLLRPLLGVAPGLLRAFLAARGVGWVEDPSNRDQRALRVRLRAGLCSGSGLGGAVAAAGRSRRRAEAETAAELAVRVSLRPEGFALLTPGRIGVETLRRLIALIGGAHYLPNPAQVADVAAELKPGTVAGVRLLPAGRLGDGILLVREEAAIGGAVAAFHGAVWDGRFRLLVHGSVPEGVTIGKLGDEAVRFRRCSALPSAILRTLPAMRAGEMLVSVPALGYKCRDNDARFKVLFCPDYAAAGAAFVPAA